MSSALSGETTIGPNSPWPYYPMILANGADAMLINYTGSMASGLTGHAHLEQHQGVLCGWYKPAQAGYLKLPFRQLPLLVESGYQIIVNDEVCDIQNYQQRFDPQQATLFSRISARGVIVEIESFLSADSVLVEHYRIAEAPRGKRVSMALYARQNRAVMGGLWGINETEVRTKLRDLSTLAFTYQAADIRGEGFLLADRPGDEPYTKFPGIRYNQVRQGFTVTKFLSLADQSDDRSYRSISSRRLADCQKAGYRVLKRRHAKDWAGYFSRHRVTLPDARLQYLYDYSLYYLRANQYPQTGGISCGPIPTLWAGGVHVPYDASFSHQALLSTNHIDEARRHIEFHRSRHPSAKKLAKAAKLPGAMFSGWSDARGKHLGMGNGRNWADYLLKYKPLMPAYLVLDAVQQWKMDPNDPAHARNLPYMKDILDLAIAKFIKQKGSLATMAPCTAGNESDIEVENDTLNGLAYAQSLIGYGQMVEALVGKSGEPYRSLGVQLLQGVEQNRCDGVLLPYPKAEYLTGLQLDFYLMTLPQQTDARSIDAAIAAIQTEWGLDSDQPSEAYRDWPWFNSRAALALSHLRDSKRAFHWLRQSVQHASALGALPEKIRLDGFAIGYGYVTAHALYAWSVAHAIAHDGPDNEIALLYGLDGQWRDLSADNIRLAGGLLLSIEVKDGSIARLKIANESRVTARRQILINPAYKGSIESRIDLKPGKMIQLIH